MFQKYNGWADFEVDMHKLYKKIYYDHNIYDSVKAINLWYRIKKQNPSLEKISMPQQNGMTIMNAIIGVCSKFHPDDISYYINRTVKTKNAKTFEKFFGFVISPKRRHDIVKQYAISLHKRR